MTKPTPPKNWNDPKQVARYRQELAELFKGIQTLSGTPLRKPKEALMTDKKTAPLSPVTIALLFQAVKTAGLNYPNETLSIIEEQLTVEQYDHCLHFLTWVNEDRASRSFGWGNIGQRIQEWVASQEKAS